MEKYPNITYDGEALNVTKTTFVFTGSSNTLSMTATYAGTGQLSVVPDEGMSDVVEGNLSYPSSIPSGNQTITITADIKPAPGSGEKIAYFYVVGGNLQRKIKLVLRPPYNFVNPRFEDVKEGTGTNEIAAGQKQDTYLKFSIPEDIDESLFPIEYKIYTKKLYAVEPGVRLETTGASDWYYVYTDQIFSPEEKVIQFKTNTANDGEDDVILKADLFNPVSDLSYTRPEKVKETKTFYLQCRRNGSNVGSNVTITYSISSGGGAAIRTNSSSRIILDKVSVYADDEITFTHTYRGSTYTAEMSVSDLAKSSTSNYVFVNMR